MWDVIWFLGFPMFAINVFGAPYETGDDSYNTPERFDVFYDQRQNGTENYKLSVDGLSLVWSPNSLLAAAALLEPALYGEYPETNIDVILGPDEIVKPGEQEKPLVGEETLIPTNQNRSSESQTVLIPESNQSVESTSQTSVIPASFNKRKVRIPGLLRPFLRKRSSIASIPAKDDKSQ
ncbi:uncharacterized protein LOC126742260 [Anthonomus grandis grandis]|uniref:uncharacterized protein LOC126742260 n=1 Tax=Anthonomus grandis grandis TaxID=2921223 RepID=UPI0021658F8B|nr:uncharacterized protein LOC126742260 [Anthonomus grandis grandis]